MPKHVEDIDTLQAYLRGVIDRADHHAIDVRDVALAVAGAIIWRKDPKPISVMAKDGEMKNVLWCWISGVRYAFSYNHTEQTIEIRKNSVQGDVLNRFSNSSSNQSVREFFKTL